MIEDKFHEYIAVLKCFIDAVKEHEISHLYETMEDSNFVKSIWKYLHRKARAELEGQRFIQDSGIESHILECKPCQSLYNAVKEAMPVLGVLEGKIK